MKTRLKAVGQATLIGCGLCTAMLGWAQQAQIDPRLVDVQKDQQGRLTAQFSKRMVVKGQESCGDGRQVKLTRTKDSKTQKEIDRPGEVPLLHLAASTGKALIVSDARCVNSVVEGTSVSLEAEPQPAPDCKQPYRRGTTGCP